VPDRPGLATVIRIWTPRGPARASSRAPADVPSTVSEGDSIHFAARRLRLALIGSPLEGVWTPSPRTRARRWDRRLRGASVERVDARGKHLLITFDNELVVHSHLRMSGSWLVRERGGAWPHPPWAAWLVMRRDDRDVVQFNGPFLHLRTRSQVAADPDLRRLGPDLCVAAEVDVPRILLRLRQDDQSRPVGDAFLDQRTMAGVGNVWKVEVCWALGIHPLRPLCDVSDADLVAMVEWMAPRIQRCGRLGTSLRPREIYGRAGRPCPACGATIAQRGSGEHNRRTFWCPACQPWDGAPAGEPREAPGGRTRVVRPSGSRRRRAP
jgi:endonuclease-8